MYIRCMYGVCGREITKDAVIYSVLFWPALHIFPRRKASGIAQVLCTLVVLGA